MSAIFNIGGMREMQVAVAMAEWLLSYKIHGCFAALNMSSVVSEDGGSHICQRGLDMGQNC
jgi:hypothetical protein